MVEHISHHRSYISSSASSYSAPSSSASRYDSGSSYTELSEMRPLMRVCIRTRIRCHRVHHRVIESETAMQGEGLERMQGEEVHDLACGYGGTLVHLESSEPGMQMGTGTQPGECEEE